MVEQRNLKLGPTHFHSESHLLFISIHVVTAPVQCLELAHAVYTVVHTGSRTGVGADLMCLHGQHDTYQTLF